MTTQSQIDRLNKEIASLRQAVAREVENEAKATAKLNRAQQGVQRASTQSALNSKLRELERVQRDLARINKKRADLDKKIADKTASLGPYNQRLAREQDVARKKAEDHQRRLLRDREQLERRISHHMTTQSIVAPLGRAVGQSLAHDFFICHASEDKDSIVRDLAVALKSRGKKVWYDEFSLRVGDSLRASVDTGLANSRFGVVILSKHFFEKDWPQKELNGLFGLETMGEKRILPIWHEISKDEVARHSPILADKIALNTSVKTAKELADELCKVLED